MHGKCANNSTNLTAYYFQKNIKANASCDLCFMGEEKSYYVTVSVFGTHDTVHQTYIDRVPHFYP